MKSLLPPVTTVKDDEALAVVRGALQDAIGRIDNDPASVVGVCLVAISQHPTIESHVETRHAFVGKDLPLLGAHLAGLVEQMLDHPNAEPVEPETPN